ncbi:Acetyltransferase (GNAT) family protein [Planococcus massiliensis]|uniref:Acetyltransferase (GNAT) family protein n=1 Tax=Planococcus massiliensis TaxID=1499687 RepID=A0A098EQD4_9BACL|nr:MULTISPECIES: GNAT family N-acetyltransferase [Planococcus]MCJ1909449.1 N-acetyltransferase [Planococcus ruber]CEG24012.1 Acetyltransferase (GNAT) family protein [Planococcus massiliensis]
MELQLIELGNDEFAYRYEEAGMLKAEITWTELANVMVIEHTFVDESMRNQGIAKKLLDRAADYAREHNYKMEPVCSYAVVAFDRYKDYDDVKI